MSRLFWDWFWSQGFEWGEPSNDFLELVYHFVGTDISSLHIADLGSGAGRYGLFLACLGSVVDCYDYSNTALSALSILSTSLESKPRLFLRDLARTSALEDQYDLIIASGLLEEIQSGDRLHVLSLISNHLTRSGVAVVRYLLNYDQTSPQTCGTHLTRGEMLTSLAKCPVSILHHAEGGRAFMDRHPLEVNGSPLDHWHDFGDVVFARN